MDIVAAVAAVVAAIAAVAVWRQAGVRWDVRGREQQYSRWHVVNTGQKVARDVRVRVESGRRPGKYTDVVTTDRVRPGEVVPVFIETTEDIPMDSAIVITWRSALGRRDRWEHPL